MRISGGSAKGRKIGLRRAFLQADEGDELRPTSAKVREALFDIIRKELPGSTFLDLYSGTGGVGIEALSRGAALATLVESNRLRAEMIRHLLSEFGFGERAAVVNARAFDFVKREIKKGRTYDIVFVDPPYLSEELMEILPFIGEGGMMREGGIVIAEHSSRTTLPGRAGMLRLKKSYQYGDTVLTIYQPFHIS